MRPCFAVASVVFEIADVSELQVFDCISFAVVVSGPVSAVEV
jgi:hypothetical protein